MLNQMVKNNEHPLSKPPFTDRDRATYDWLIAQYGPWYISHETYVAAFSWHDSQSDRIITISFDPPPELG